MFRRDYLCIRWSRCEHLSYYKWSRITGKNGVGHIVLFRVIHDKRAEWGSEVATFLYKMFSSTLSRCERASIKDSDVFKVGPFYFTMKKYQRIQNYCGGCYANGRLTQWFLVSLFFFFFYCCRQVQRLRNLKGAKCEEHHHQRPWGPAMLGARLHVVSVIAPVSRVCVLVTRISSALAVHYIRFMLDNVYFWPWDEEIPPVRLINGAFIDPGGIANNTQENLNLIHKADIV